MKNPLANLMQHAQKMQENVKRIQEELAAAQVQGESGGGLVKVVMTGRKQCLRVQIDDSLLGDDREMLEDLVTAAINDAINRSNRLKEEKMGSLTGGFELPPGFKLPL